MIQIRRSQDRGQAHHGWLKSLHTFSFADYYDPQQMGFRTLRVINEDRIQGGTGFGSHPHREMEIISYVMSGALEHKDSMGNQVVIRSGEVQRMSAGTGVVHSEYNHMPDQETHFFQIWILPKSRGGAPEYGQKAFDQELSKKKLVLVASDGGRDGSLDIRQDADIYVSKLKSGEQIEFHLRSGRGVWIQVLKGQLDINGQKLNGGDAASTESETVLKFGAEADSELMLFDLA